MANAAYFVGGLAVGFVLGCIFRNQAINEGRLALSKAHETIHNITKRI